LQHIGAHHHSVTASSLLSSEILTRLHQAG
jgi:hypothetical protein